MQLTTLKLRSLKPCSSTTEMLNSLPDIQGFGESMFRFDVKIPTKLWKSLLRRRKLVTDGRYYNTCLELEQARTENDIAIIPYNDEQILIGLNLQGVMPNAVYVEPVDIELFDRFDISVLRAVALFRSPDIINLNVVLHGIGDYTIEAIFDVRRFPDLTERPSGALVSYTINI